MAVASVCLIYFSLFAALPARERVTDLSGGTGRTDLWTVGWRMVQDRPLLGVGVGNFQNASIHYLLRPGAIQRDDLIFVCEVGQRSAVAAEMAAALGMQRVYNLEGGMTAWRREQLPVER